MSIQSHRRNESGSNAPTQQTTWSLLRTFTAKHGLPRRSCLVCGEIKNVTGPTRHELMILTGLMGARMLRKAYLKHEVIPVSVPSFTMSNTKLTLSDTHAIHIR